MFWLGQPDPSETPLEPKVFSADLHILFIFQRIFAIFAVFTGFYGILGLLKKCKKKLNPYPT